MTRSTEDELIARYFVPMAGPGGLRLADDAALLAPSSGCELVLTVDAIAAGVHFFAHDPAETIAAKALGVNLSDLAAKGARPVGFLLALALPDDWTDAWLAAFCGGLAATSAAASCPLLGGDTVRSAGPLLVSITALGEVPAGTMVLRTNAKPGDVICISGTIGDAVMGLALLGTTEPVWRAALSEDDVRYAVDRYRRPQARLGLAGPLRDVAHGAMDVSDGLVGDLAKMLRASGVAGRLDLDEVPLSEAARRGIEGDPFLLDRLVTGGDDYEIVFTLPPERFDEMHRRAADAGIAITAIGRVEAGASQLALMSRGVPHRIAAHSFQHFGSSP